MKLNLHSNNITYNIEDGYIVSKDKESEFEIAQEDIEKLSLELKLFLNLNF
jgi:hypothetical protein